MHNDNALPVRFRPAMPHEAPAVVPLILSSGPDVFEFVLRMRRSSPADFLLFAFARSAGQFSHRNHVVGELDGKIVAAGAAWSGARNFSFAVAAAWQLVAYFGPLGAAQIASRGIRSETVMHPPATGEWYIGHLGVAAACRGRGIGESLIAHLAAAGAKAGLSRAVLDVSCENPRAEALYTRIGFSVTAERPSKLRRAAGFVPSHRRMERALLDKVRKQAVLF